MGCVDARALHRVLKLARTIADLAGLESIGAAQVAAGRACARHRPVSWLLPVDRPVRRVQAHRERYE
ncbi:MAG: hypothetical protein HYY04_04685 [Chloroflexi bacterium]|nr:hypothetical protein [Chloroflexota bacterium]